jgi:dienelactone hydrolase
VACLCSDPGVLLKADTEAAVDGDGRPVLRGKAPFRRPETEDLRWVSFDYYRADGEAGDPRPAVVISPITGGGYEVSRLLARDLTAHGYHAVIVKRPENEKALRRQVELGGFETVMRDAIAARRRVIDWLVTRDEVDARRIGAYGVSLGGVLTAVLAAVDERVVASVVVMGCGDLPALLCRSVEPEARRLARAHGVPENPVPADLQAFEDLAGPILQTDPQRLARHVDSREIFLVTTRRDKSVPTVLQDRLHEALGGPESLSLPTGHYSAVVYLPVILERARGFLARRFSAVGPD